MKKGFTLVEIIISIAIIAIIGVSTTFVITKSTSTNELENATKQILEAANLYVKTEKDDNGNEYATQVLSGAKGIQIPLSNLVNKGYIDETMAETIYENKGNPSSDQDYYVMFLQGDGEEEKNYCDDGSTVTIASWTMETGKDIYLCNDFEEDLTLYNLIEKLWQESGKTTATSNNKDGVYLVKNEENTIDGKAVYFFTGQNNNYVKIDDDLYYIVRTTEDIGIKLLLVEQKEVEYIDPDSDEPYYLYSREHPEGDNSIYMLLGYPPREQTAYSSINPDYYNVNSYRYTSSDTLQYITGLRYFGRPIYENFYLIDSNCKFKVWGDGCDYNVNGNIYHSFSKIIYNNVENWYIENVKNKYDDLIKTDYKWCTSNINDVFLIPSYSSSSEYSIYQFKINLNFKCKDGGVLANFGLLNIVEYSAIMQSTEDFYISKLYDQEISFFESFPDITLYSSLGDIITSHMAMPSNNMEKTEDNDHYYLKFRPSIVLKGNVEVISGTGTLDDPYIIGD